MINIEDEKQEVKKKSLLEKIAPLVLVALLIFAGFFVFNNFNLGGGEDVIIDSGNDQLIEQVKMDELIKFINSPEFNNLVHIPDPDIFN